MTKQMPDHPTQNTPQTTNRQIHDGNAGVKAKMNELNIGNLTNVALKQTQDELQHYMEENRSLRPMAELGKWVLDMARQDQANYDGPLHVGTPKFLRSHCKMILQRAKDMGID